MRLVFANNLNKQKTNENSSIETRYSKNLKVAILVRVSTAKEEQKSSLDTQKKIFTRMCEENNWEIYDIYEEVESGTRTNRKGLNQLINDAKEGKFNLILAKELSRLARNVPLAYQLREILNKYKVHLKTLDGAIDTLNGDLDKFGLYAWIYEQESQKISNRLKQTFRARAKEGEFNGSEPPYGYYLKDKKLYVRDDYTPEVVKRIFNMYLQGKGFDAIARQLYNESIPTPAQLKGKSNASDKWHGSTIKVILTNPHYTGILVQCRDTKPSVTDKRQPLPESEYVIIENAHEPLISIEMFNTVQELIISRSRIRPQAEVHLFTNTIFCADCGRGMHFKKNRKGYVCGNFNKHGSKACSDHFIKERELEEIILNDIKSIAQQMDLDGLIDRVIKQLESDTKNNTNRLSQVEQNIEKLKKQKVQLTSLLADNSIDIEEYRLTIEEINKKIDDLMSDKLKLEKSKDQSKRERKNMKQLKNELKEYIHFNKLTPEMLHRLVDRIEIKEDGSPKIYYRFANDFLNE